MFIYLIIQRKQNPGGPSTGRGGSDQDELEDYD
jgi:hypothetical protein